MKTTTHTGATLPATTGSASWFKTSSYYDTIETVEVSRHTEKCVWIVETHAYNGKRVERRHGRMTDYARYWQTREEAVAHMIQREERKLGNAESQAAKSRAVLETFRPNAAVKPSPL